MLLQFLPDRSTLFAVLLLTAFVLGTGLATAQDAPECEPGFRLYTHELLWHEIAEGVCIPEQPQRIAYAWPFHIPALLRADYPFAGLSNPSYVANQFPAWADAVADMPAIGLPPNLETTLTLAPDLIIEPGWAAEDNYDELSAIAPTIAFTFDGTHQWKQLAEMYFDVAGLSDAYDALMAEYEARAQELGALIGNPGEIEVSLVWVSEGLNLDTNYSSGGMVLEDIGFARPASQILTQTPEEILAENGIPFFTTLSWEEAPLADGDFIIAYGDFGSEEGEQVLADLQANPLWQTLSAVQAGNVYYSSVNWAGGDIAGAHNLLDDVAAAFGVADQLSANPYTTTEPLTAPAESTEAPAN